nr:DUF1654 domain-containing protein [Pseudomonas daroniae]
MTFSRTINAPAAKKSRSAVLLRTEGDSPDDWACILDEIAETTTSPSSGATTACSCSGRYRRIVARKTPFKTPAQDQRLHRAHL